MLIYNYYTSRPYNGQADTRITLTNSYETSVVQVKLYFVDGVTGLAMPQQFTPAPVQTQSLLRRRANWRWIRSPVRPTASSRCWLSIGLTGVCTAECPPSAH